jgi:hypothetical protein
MFTQVYTNYQQILSWVSLLDYLYDPNSFNFFYLSISLSIISMACNPNLFTIRLAISGPIPLITPDLGIQ